MVLHCLQSQLLSKYVPASIIQFMTPDAFDDSSINCVMLHRVCSLSFRLFLIITLVELPLCRTSGLQKQPCLLLLQENKKMCHGLTDLASMCPAEVLSLPWTKSLHDFCIAVHLGKKLSISEVGLGLAHCSCFGGRAK